MILIKKRKEEKKKFENKFIHGFFKLELNAMKIQTNFAFMLFASELINAERIYRRRIVIYR